MATLATMAPLRLPMPDAMSADIGTDGTGLVPTTAGNPTWFGDVLKRLIS